MAISLHHFNGKFSNGKWPSSVQFSCSVFATPWTAARLASLSITNSQSPPKPMSIESGMPSNRLILCRPLLLLPPVFPSISIFSNESALHIRWPKYWSFIMSHFSKWRHYQVGKEWPFHWFLTLICSHKLGENVWSLNTLVLCLYLVFCVQLSATPWTVAHQASLSVEFSRPEYWSG